MSTGFMVALAILILFVGFLLLRAFRFRPTDSGLVETQNVQLQEDQILSDFRKLLQCKTVSHFDREEMDLAEFQRFKELLQELYPNVHRVCIREEIGFNGILYRWKGEASEEPTVLMSHYDVVPVEEELWSKPPFEAVVDDGVVWGRGTLDTKVTLCAILEAAESLIGEGYIPAQDLYFSFTGEEEISGNSTPEIVNVLFERGVKPALVLDEGGAVVENVFPGITKPCALIGVGEKGYLDVDLELTGQGGHSSSPHRHSVVEALSQAVVKLERKPFPARMTPPVRAMFDQMGRHSSLGYRLLFANLWLFQPLVNLFFSLQGGELNALIQTTCVATKMEGSKAYNIIPPKAKIGLNLRLLAPDTVESALSRLKSVIGDDRIVLRVVESNEATPHTASKSVQWDRVKNCILQTWPGVIVSPLLMTGATDSRHYCRISDTVLRFSPMQLTEEDMELIHGNDERIKIDNLLDAVAFFTRLIQKST